MTAKSPRAVAAILVSYNTVDLLRQVLEDLAGLVPHTIVIDNASGDGSAAMVTTEFPDVLLISNKENVGFARAVNRALARTEGMNVLLINPDCRISRDAFERLTGHLESHPNCGVAAPRTEHPVRSQGILAAGKQPSTRSLFNHYFGLTAVFPHASWAQGWHLRSRSHGTRTTSVEWVSGACMLIRREVFDSVPRLSEEWFMYGEDMDFCRRVTSAGWTVSHVGEARVEHLIGASSSERSRINDRWVSVLLDYHRRYLSRSLLDHYRARLVVACGLLLRAWRNGLMARKGGEASSAYELEARRNVVWARRALQPENVRLDEPTA